MLFLLKIFITIKSWFLQCSFADCVNYKKSQEPFYLHPPSLVSGSINSQQPNGTGRGVGGVGKVAVRDGLYVVSPTAQTTTQHHHQTIVKSAVEPVKSPQQGPFYLHDPNPGTIDDPVKDIFVIDKTSAATYAPPPPPPPAIGLNTMTGKKRSLLNL